MVLTHFDKINQQSDSLQTTVSLVQRLREKFQGFIEFYPTVFTVDARSSASVGKLGHHIRKTSKTILERVPRVYQLCNDLVEILSDWRQENRNKPAMKWKEFGELCQVRVPALRIRSRHDNKEKIEMRRRAVATNLHHIGAQSANKTRCQKPNTTEKSGFICRKDFEKILIGSLQSRIPGMGSNVIENLEPSDLIKMMLKLELCCEQDPSDPNSPLLIPSNLEEGRWKPQRWPVNSPDNNYVGRRLQCDDSSHMFLTPGFFPRLQASLIFLSSL
ncbi:UNVERIFIED_CONTAM: protein TORNADO 1 [Sesamum radiatum]|uniref:Protein TORNADO 1 n=1 Tax=Sesamum radiatum TaxID=300843 RepID=A0AAW2KK03_SESRA